MERTAYPELSLAPSINAPSPLPHSTYVLQCIIQYVMPEDDKMLKKLLLIYWEIVPKHGADGKLLHEMILVCDA